MKMFFILFTSFLGLAGFSQSQHGLVHYGEIQSMGMGAAVGTDMRAILIFDHTRSLYITRQDSLEGRHISEQKSYKTSSGGGFSKTVSTNERGFRYYNDLQTHSFFSRDIGFKYVKETTPTISWNITNESKAIGNLTVYKATANFRGRHYTAWFTMEIPLPFGPWKLQGLPGLIIEAYDTNKEIYWYFKDLQYPTEQGYLLKPLSQEKSWISQTQYSRGLYQAWKNARAGSIMAVKDIGAPTPQEDKAGMLRTYIEDFTEGND